MKTNFHGFARPHIAGILIFLFTCASVTLGQSGSLRPGT